MGDLVPIIAIVFGLGVPVTALAVKFVLHPLVKDLTGAIKGRDLQDASELQRRVARLEGLLEGYGETLERLVEAEAFRRQLESAQGAASPPPPSRPEG